MTASEYRDWTITLTFDVAPGDTEGVMTEAVFEAALAAAPSEAAGMVARANTREGKVWITFTLVQASSELAHEIADSMPALVREAMLAETESCVSAA